MDVLDRTDLSFSRSLPEFQRLFPDDATCAADLEKARWGDDLRLIASGSAVTARVTPQAGPQPKVEPTKSEAKRTTRRTFPVSPR
jgi:hypothetical protein